MRTSLGVDQTRRGASGSVRNDETLLLNPVQAGVIVTGLLRADRRERPALTTADRALHGALYFPGPKSGVSRGGTDDRPKSRSGGFYNDCARTGYFTFLDE